MICARSVYFGYCDFSLGGHGMGTRVWSTGSFFEDVLIRLMIGLIGPLSQR
jgi:hypothetical protein